MTIFVILYNFNILQHKFIHLFVYQRIYYLPLPLIKEIPLRAYTLYRSLYLQIHALHDSVYGPNKHRGERRRGWGPSYTIFDVGFRLTSHKFFILIMLHN